jgi:hypothetical protein
VISEPCVEEILSFLFGLSRQEWFLTPRPDEAAAGVAVPR